MSAVIFDNAVAVTPDNSNDLPSGVCNGLFIGGAGNINIDDGRGGTVILHGLTAGTVLNMRIKRVRSTSTTATNIRALYSAEGVLS